MCFKLGQAEFVQRLDLWFEYFLSDTDVLFKASENGTFHGIEMLDSEAEQLG